MATDVVPVASAFEQLYSELARKVKEARPKDDLSNLEKAYRLAAEARKHQFRGNRRRFP